MVRRILDWIGNFFNNLFSSTLRFLKDMFGGFFQALIDVLKAIFRPILILVAMVMYFVYQLGVVVVTLIKVLLGIGKLLYALVAGLLKTLAGLVWIPTTPDHGQWSAPIREAFASFNFFQLDSLAYVLLFLIWFGTAFGAIKILTGRGAA